MPAGGDRRPTSAPLETRRDADRLLQAHVRVRGREAPLTFVEFEILSALARAPGRVFTRDMLLARIWGDSAYRDPRTIDVHIRHLREKLERDPKDPEYLFTVRGRRLPVPRHRSSRSWLREPGRSGAGGGLPASASAFASRTRHRMTLSLRNRLALVFSAITFLALAALYVYVAPGLQTPCSQRPALGAGGRRPDVAFGRRSRRTVGSSMPLPMVQDACQRRRARHRRPGDAAPGQPGAGGRPSSPTLADSSRRSATAALSFAVARRPRSRRRLVTGTEDDAGRARSPMAADPVLVSVPRPRVAAVIVYSAPGLGHRPHRGDRPPPDPGRRRDRAAARAGRELPDGARAGPARQAPGAGGRAGRGGRLRARRSRSTPATSSGSSRSRSTRCSASWPSSSRRARSSSRPPRTSCARRSSRSADSSSCSRTRSSTPRPARASSSRFEIRSSVCASCRSTCSTSRAWSPGRWSCGPSRSTSAS